jgi:hypothetical protein
MPIRLWNFTIQHFHSGIYINYCKTWYVWLVSSSSSNVSETISFVIETNFRFLPLQTAAIFYLWLVVSISVISNSTQSNTLPRIRVVHDPHTLRDQCLTIDIHPSRLEYGAVHFEMWESVHRRRLLFLSSGYFKKSSIVVDFLYSIPWF